MANRKIETPEFLKIKGYKYRAKILAAASAILILLIILIIVIINGIVSAIKGSDNDDNDVNANINTSSAISSSQNNKAETDSEIVESFVSNIEVNHAENYTIDADGKIEIDTDTLDGQKAVAITFDDGPGDYTEKLLDELRKRNVKATFFMLGSCVEKHPEVLSVMAADGHQLGSHTYEHLDITKLSTKELNEQINKTDNAIYNACGQKATAFRPPYGAYTNDTIANIDKTVTLWSMDTLDWKSRDAKSVKENIINQCTDGSIILLHDIYESSVKGVLAAIDELQKKGYVFVTVDELIERYGHDIVTGRVYTSQYAVYETNSPEAEKYESEMASSAAQSSASDFYYVNSDDSEERSPKIADEIDTENDLSTTSSEKLIY